MSRITALKTRCHRNGKITSRQMRQTRVYMVEHIHTPSFLQVSDSVRQQEIFGAQTQPCNIVGTEKRRKQQFPDAYVYICICTYILCMYTCTYKGINQHKTTRVCRVQTHLLCDFILIGKLDAVAIQRLQPILRIQTPH